MKIFIGERTFLKEIFQPLYGPLAKPETQHISVVKKKPLMSSNVLHCPAFSTFSAYPKQTHVKGLSHTTALKRLLHALPKYTLQTPRLRTQ